MPILICQDCEKRYRFDGKPGGKVLRCPACGTRLERVADVPMRQLLKHELARLSAGPLTEEPDEAAGAKVRVAERAPRRIGLWVLCSLLTLVVLGGAGAAWWAYARAHRAPPELPAQTRAAITKAQRGDVPGAEGSAVADWHAARGMIVVYRIRQGLPDAFQDEIDRIDERIAQLQATIRQRQIGVQPLQKALTEARTALDSGRAQEAVKSLEALLPEIARADVPGIDRERLRTETESLLTLARAAATTTRPPVSSPPGRPARRGPRGATGSTPTTSAPPAATTPAPATASAAGELLLDRPADTLAWRAETWANPAALGLEAGSAVAVRQDAGGSDKWAISLDRPLDVSGYGKLTLEVDSAGPARLAIAVWTGPTRTMFESPPETVRGGGWREVSFALKGRRFKCQATNWQFGAALENPDAVTRITLLFYDQSQTPLRIRNVRLVP